MLHCAGDAVQLPDKLFELFQTAKVQAAVPQKADGQHHENRQADGQCGEYHVEEQRIEGCERWSQWCLQMQAPEARIQQCGSDDKRRGEIAMSPGESGYRTSPVPLLHLSHKAHLHQAAPRKLTFLLRSRLLRSRYVGQLTLNRPSDQLPLRTPPAIVSREHREKPGSPPSSPANDPTTDFQFRLSIRLTVSAPTPPPTRSLWQTPCFPYLLYFLPFARSSTLLPLFFAPASFIFNRLRPLLRKHRGWHTPPRPSRVAGHQSQVTSVVRKSAKRPSCKFFACHSYGLPVA